MCNPRQGEGQRVLEEDDVEPIALIAYIGGNNECRKTPDKKTIKVLPKD